MAQTKGYFVANTAVTGANAYLASVVNGEHVMTAVGTTNVVAGVSSLLKDMGKTIVLNEENYNSNAKVFRKVQLLNSLADATFSNGGISGSNYSATVASNYQTFYIELPSLGNGNSGTPLNYSYVPLGGL
jgi:hypothetical protein